MIERGKIRNENYAKQLRDFSGLRYGNITPTDIDVFMEFGDKDFVFVEAKYGKADLPLGQKLALERLVDCVGETHRQSLLIIAYHNVPYSDYVDIAKCGVKEYRSNHQWRKPKNNITVREMIDKFREQRRQMEMRV